MRIFVRCRNCKGALAVIDYKQIDSAIAWLSGKVPKEPVLYLGLHVCETVWKKYPTDFVDPEKELETKKLE